MNLTDTQSVLESIAVIDGRPVSESTIREWHRVIGHLDADDVRAATKACLLELQIRVMPAHINSKVREIARERDLRQASQREHESKPFDTTIPFCEHNKKILHCSACQVRLAEEDVCGHGKAPIACVVCEHTYRGLSRTEWLKNKSLF